MNCILHWHLFQLHHFIQVYLYQMFICCKFTKLFKSLCTLFHYFTSFVVWTHFTDTFDHSLALYLLFQVYDWSEAIKPSTEPNRECLPWFPWAWGEITLTLLAIFNCTLSIVKYGSCTSCCIKKREPKVSRFTCAWSQLFVLHLISAWTQGWADMCKNPSLKSLSMCSLLLFDFKSKWIMELLL
jgi:hypothetical protein